MSIVSVNISCCLCGKDHETTIDTGDFLIKRDYGIDIEDGFCPDHAEIHDFTNSQCLGCVGRWIDCGLWRDFAYSKNNLTDDDHIKLCNGVCPRRVNGVFSVDVSNGLCISDVDCSTESNIAGAKLSIAIKEWVEKYHEVQS